MCGSMADIQSATPEIRRGKKERRKKEITTGQKYNGLPYSIGTIKSREESVAQLWIFAKKINRNLMIYDNMDIDDNLLKVINYFSMFMFFRIR